MTLRRHLLNWSTFFLAPQRITAILVLLIIPALSGCVGLAATAAGGGVYETAAEERSLGTIIDDNALEARIKLAFVEDDDVKALDISVHVYSGHAYLVGVVDGMVQGVRAVAVAKAVEGVRSVTPYFLDSAGESVTGFMGDSLITAKVRTRLLQEPDLESTQITLKTVQGHVVLLGVVGDEEAAARAVELAEGTEGVQEVKSFLRVAPMAEN